MAFYNNSKEEGGPQSPPEWLYLNNVRFYMLVVCPSQGNYFNKVFMLYWKWLWHALPRLMTRNAWKLKWWSGLLMEIVEGLKASSFSSYGTFSIYENRDSCPSWINTLSFDRILFRLSFKDTFERCVYWSVRHKRFLTFFLPHRPVSCLTTFRGPALKVWQITCLRGGCSGRWVCQKQLAKVSRGTSECNWERIRSLFKIKYFGGFLQPLHRWRKLP